MRNLVWFRRDHGDGIAIGDTGDRAFLNALGWLGGARGSGRRGVGHVADV
jgi:hypothetical protein